MRQCPLSFVRLKFCGEIEVVAPVCATEKTEREKARRNMSRILTMFSSFI